LATTNFQHLTPLVLVRYFFTKISPLKHDSIMLSRVMNPSAP